MPRSSISSHLENPPESRHAERRSLARACSCHVELVISRACVHSCSWGSARARHTFQAAAGCRAGGHGTLPWQSGPVGGGQGTRACPPHRPCRGLTVGLHARHSQARTWTAAGRLEPQLGHCPAGCLGRVLSLSGPQCPLHSANDIHASLTGFR